MAVGFSLALAAVNLLWLLTSWHSGPVYALVFYALAAYLCGRRDDFRAAFIIGFAGLVIHTCELVLQGLGGLTLQEESLFFANLVLPTLLMFFSLRAYRQHKKRTE